MYFENGKESGLIDFILARIHRSYKKRAFYNNWK